MLLLADPAPLVFRRCKRSVGRLRDRDLQPPWWFRLVAWASPSVRRSLAVVRRRLPVVARPRRLRARGCGSDPREVEALRYRKMALVGAPNVVVDAVHESSADRHVSPWHAANSTWRGWPCRPCRLIAGALSQCTCRACRTLSGRDDPRRPARRQHRPGLLGSLCLAPPGQPGAFPRVRWALGGSRILRAPGPVAGLDGGGLRRCPMCLLRLTTSGAMKNVQRH